MYMINESPGTGNTMVKSSLPASAASAETSAVVNYFNAFSICILVICSNTFTKYAYINN